MIAQILKKSGAFICSYCRMTQQELRENCSFCGAIFSNYEEELIKSFEEDEYDEIYR